ISVEVTATDKSGNTNSIDHQIKVDLDGPLLTIDTVAVDDVINAVEALTGVPISGTATAGAEIVVKLGDDELVTVADDKGHWSVKVLPEQLELLDGDISVEVIATDKSGNTNSIDHQIKVDLDGPLLTIDTVAADDVINAVEALAGVAITGTATAGSSIVVKLAGEELLAVADEQGHWSVTVLPDVLNALDGEVNVEVIATDEAGNTESLDHLIHVDVGLPNLTIDTVAGDDLINATEALAGVTINGTATAGSSIVVKLAGEELVVVADETGHWSVNVLPGVLNALDGEVNVEVIATDEAGNTESLDHLITVDTGVPTVAIDAISGDGVISAAEVAAGIAITGIATAGSKVVLSIGGEDYNVTVGDDGKWSVNVPATVWDNVYGEVVVKAVASDEAGNTADASRSITVETPALTISTVAGDDIINAAEHGEGLEISGTSGGLEAGQILNIELNGKAYTVEIGANGGWVLSVPAADVQALQNGKYTIVTSVDGIGDLVSVDHDIVVDTTAPTITIDPVAENGIIDAAELTEAVTISGTTTGLAGGENIYVILNGWKYTGKVAADGSWSLDIPKAYAEELENGTHRLTANVSDASGNTARSFVDVSVQGHSGIVSVGEDFQGTWDEEDPSVIDMVAGDSYTLKSGLTMTGIQNGVIEEGTAVKEQYVFNISGTGYYWGEGTGDLVTHVDGGAIGEFSFGRQVNSVSFLYAAVDRDCYVEIYDADGHEIDRVRLDGNNTGEPEDNLPVQKFSYEAQEGVAIDHIRINATDEKWGMSVDDFRWTYHDDVAADQHNVTTEAGTSGGLEALAAVAMDDNAVSGSAGNDHLAGTADNDHFTIGNGGGDLLTYHLLNAADATGGNGADRVAGFTVGSGADADRIDLRELLADTSYSAEGKPDVEALAEFLKVTVKGNDTEIAIDRDGAGKAHEMTTLVTLSDVQTDLATLLANHQLVV
ncbi:Ig-like domain-containing protein, partial [Halomonas cupida]|uniref:Ig-like domain-containing protein n=1 Tax=Halomonas cupida TaxID=44933 RepID=UPI0011BD82E9